MKVYDIRTKVIETIEDAGGSIENPRFVLVYDSKSESGDINTRGYDLESGEVVDLSNKPAKLPKDIPDPEEGEKKALVSPPTGPKSKLDGEEDDTGTSTPPVTSDDGDLIIPPASETVSTTTSEVEIDETFDIVIPSEDSSSSGVDHIEDLIIAPLDKEMSDDSQSGVASST